MNPSLQLIEQKAKRLAGHSWEYGVILEALLELHNPELSVFAKQPAFFSANALESVEALKYVKDFIKTDGPVLIDGEGK